MPRKFASAPERAVPFRRGVRYLGGRMLERRHDVEATDGPGQAPYRTVMRRSDEPKLEIGDAISMEEGVVGVVLARYTRSGDVRNDVHYVVELRGETEDKA